MVSSYKRPLVALAVGVVMLLAAVAVPVIAADLQKLWVPSSYIKDSKNTKGRVFYRTAVPENALVGIRLGRRANEVLSKYGDPSRVVVGQPSQRTNQQMMPGAMPSPGMPQLPYAPGMGQGDGSDMAPGPMMRPGMPGMGGLPGAGMQPPGMMNLPGAMGTPGPMGLPGMGPGMAPGMARIPGAGGPPGMAGMPGGPGMLGLGGPTPLGMQGAQPQQQPWGGASSRLQENQIAWTYDLTNGVTLEFELTDGIVTSITAVGKGPYTPSRTRMGLELGDSYRLALLVAGFPETQISESRFIIARYPQKRATLTFDRNKLVGINVAIEADEE